MTTRKNPRGKDPVLEGAKGYSTGPVNKKQRRSRVKNIINVQIRKKKAVSDG